MAPRLSAAARGVRAALLLCAAARRAAPQATPWAYQPHSYYWLEFDDCETKDFASGPCAVPATFQYDSTDVQESCDMTAYGQAQGINLAVCDINLAGANAGSDAILCDSAGDPPSDAYCAYTAEETVLSPFSLPPVDLVRGENFTISWHISGFVCSTLTQVQCQSAAATCKWSAGSCQEYTSTSRGPSISNPATRRSFVMITQEDCPATLTGRRSFLQEQCETLETAGACNAAGAPCLWDAADGEPPCCSCSRSRSCSSFSSFSPS